MPRICAIILAAGESRRMGTNKLILPFHGQPMISRVISNVLQAGIGDILVVTGAFRDEMLPLLNGLPVRHCYNPHYKKGMLSSVQCGFRHLQDPEDAVMLFLGDQPMLPPTVAPLLVEAYERSHKSIMVPVYRGRRGHPVLIAGTHRQTIDTLSPDEGLRALLRICANDVEEVPVDIPDILRDIDDQKDYTDEMKLK